MADAVAFAGVEEQHLIRFGNGLIAPEVPYIDPAIGKDEFGCVRALFGARRGATSLTVHIPDSHIGSVEERPNCDFGDWSVVFVWHCCFVS